VLIAYNLSRAKYFAQATTQRFKICHAPIERRFPFACEGTSMRLHIHSTGAHGAAASRALAERMSDAMAKELMPLVASIYESMHLTEMQPTPIRQ
jgi:hypothetical protein